MVTPSLASAIWTDSTASAAAPTPPHDFPCRLQCLGGKHGEEDLAILPFLVQVYGEEDLATLPFLVQVLRDAMMQSQV